MCTVVVRRGDTPEPTILALRDEDVARDFDEPDRWWPTQPDVVGGRDRTAGGSWCVTDVASGVTALVLNRPEQRVAAPGAASRGLLPLLAVQHGARWSEHLDLDGMAAFALLRVGASKTDLWEYDGKLLRRTEIGFGTTMVTSGGPEDERAARHLDAFRVSSFPDGWRDLVTAQQPAEDRAALVVRHVTAKGTYGTVFGQLIRAQPGRLELSTSREPWLPDGWTDRAWGADAAQAGLETPYSPRS